MSQRDKMEEVLLTRLHTIVQNIQRFTEQAVELAGSLSDENMEEAEIVLKKFETFNTRFSMELNNYLRISVEPSVEDISSFGTIQLSAEEVFAELSCKIKTIKTKEKGDFGKNTTAFSTKLPKLNLPVFDGQILEWQSFWDHFSSNIDSRNIPNVDKLLYLKSSLKGRAEKAIEGLEITNKNYPIAIATLKERYGKENQIIDAHYAALYSVKTANLTPTDCRRALNEIERHLRVLSSLGEDTNHNHLRFLITQKFPEDVIYEMRLALTTDSIEDIRKRLDNIISAREDASRISLENQGKDGHYTVETLHTRQQTFRPNFDRQHEAMSTNPTFFNRQRTQVERPVRRGQEFVRNRRYQTERQDRATKMGHNFGGKNYKRKFNVNSNEGSREKQRKIQCAFCDGSHYSDLCKSVTTLSTRKQKLKGKCYSCFEPGHPIAQCRKGRKCAHCGVYGTHNRALCPNLFKGRSTDCTRVMHTGENHGPRMIVLQTAIVQATSPDGSKSRGCRILMDSASQRTYVTKETAKCLNLPIVEENHLSVFTFGSDKPQEYDSPLVKLHIRTRTNKEKTLYANVVPNICQEVYYPKEILRNLKSEKNILADDGSLGNRIDILIGNDYYFSLMTTEKHQLEENLFLVNSDFGWILTGKIEVKAEEDLSVATYVQSVTDCKFTKPDLPLNEINIKALWDLESIGITDSPNTTKEEEALRNFNETTEYVDQRYAVSWPWKEYPPDLPTNKGLARGRLVHLLRRMNRESLKSYNDTIMEQLEKGIVEVVPANEIDSCEFPVHYLAHHGVQTPGKPTRIVYDGSGKLKDHKSLNECLLAGPTLLEDLTGLLIRFRSHKIGITADVEKAFLQLSLKTNSRDVTRFLWLRDVSKPATDDNILHLRFCRVPFGIISSPFLLNATIKHHLTKSTDKDVQRVSGDIYVDNLVSGTSNTKQALELYRHLKEEFQKISMNLREWSSNSLEFTQNISDKNHDEVIKVLGLDWNTKRDTLHLRRNNIVILATKRGILKTVASIYDPCGFIVPAILAPKLFIQNLWKLKVKWDEELSTELKTEWKDIFDDLNDIQVTLPRCYTQTKDDLENSQLHCFTDASAKAYAAVVYIVNKDGKEFVIGKSRLTPIKDQENLKIPRLELLGVIIGCRLLKYVEKSLQKEIPKQFLWTDSQIVIDWVKSNKLLTPFVARRVQEIKQNKNLSVRFICSELNPADVATRPNKTKVERSYWLKGPDFINKSSEAWPTNILTEVSFSAREGLSTTDVSTPQESSSPEEEEIQDHTISKDHEIEEIRKLQKYFFPDESNNKETSLSRNLKLFKDEDGLLRCRGRMENTEWSFDMKYPVLLPKNCDFTDKLIMKVHEENYHVGANHTLSNIRKYYWIPQGKAKVQSIIRRCPNCIKHGGGPFKLPSVPALPPERVNYSAPFTYTGVDYLGELYVNNDKEEKRWICLYTCLAVRCVHLEVVKSLSAEECLLALRRFISTRGLPSVIISDNASMFKLNAEVLADEYCIKNKIQWRFITPLAPWKGGFYERLIGIVKHCLKRTLGKHLLNDSQMNTVVKEIEAVLNSRPLTCVDAEIVHVLSPADFLAVGKCITSEFNTEELENLQGTTTKLELIKSWKRGIKIIEEFKEMFVNRYLLSLRERYKHSVKEPRIRSHLMPKVGQVVQIREDTKNRHNWKVGRITSLIIGKDGQCRVAKVRVADKEFIRSIAHLYPLELEDNEESTYVEETTEDLPNLSRCILPSFTRNLTSPHLLQDTSQHEAEEVEMDMPHGVTEINEDGGNDLVVEHNITTEELSENLMEDQENSDNIEIRQNVTGEERSMNSPPKASRPRREAASKALAKIHEWTRNLVAFLNFSPSGVSRRVAAGSTRCRY